MSKGIFKFFLIKFKFFFQTVFFFQTMFFFQTVFDFFSVFIFFQKGFWILLCFYFFQKGFWFFVFFKLFFFSIFFYKNYYHFTKGKEPARSPKPAVSFPLNPFHLGHGLGLCPKNLATLEVSSVSYEQICVDIFLEYVRMLLWNISF